MAFYAIGDIQGCFDEFQLLLEKIKFDPNNDILWLTGDLVNRGPKSVDVLRFVKKYQNSILTILGNHDLHLLAVAFAGKKQKKGDTIQDVLDAPDRDELLHWLRAQPLIRVAGNKAMVHAALYPDWTIEAAQGYAQEVEKQIQGVGYISFFEQMYGNTPNSFSEELTGMDRYRAIVNIYTRTRFITRKNKLDFDYKGTIADAPTKLIPWYKAEKRSNLDHTIIFGHWSALGVYHGENVLCLDSGAIWGGPLTAVNLDTYELFQVLNMDNKIEEFSDM